MNDRIVIKNANILLPSGLVFGKDLVLKDGKIFDVVKDAEKIEKLGKLITILGNSGLEASGQEPDLTAKWVLRNMRPALILPFAIATMAEINEGNMMEVKPEEKGPVDEILEEERAKKPQGN